VRQLPSVPKNAISLNHRYLNVFTNSCGEPFFDVRSTPAEEKGSYLLTLIGTPEHEAHRHAVHSHVFDRLPNAIISYDILPFVEHAFSSYPNFLESGYVGYIGAQMRTEQYFLLYWERPLNEALGPDHDYCHLYNGGDYQRFCLPPRDIAYFGPGGRNVDQSDTSYTWRLRSGGAGEQYFKHGVGFGKRGEYFDAHFVRVGHLFTTEGQLIPIDAVEDGWTILALLNSSAYQVILNTFCGNHKTSGYINLLPLPPIGPIERSKLVTLAKDQYHLLEQWYAGDPTTLCFTSNRAVQRRDLLSLTEIAAQIAKQRIEVNLHIKDLAIRQNRLVEEICGVRQDEEVRKCREIEGNTLQDVIPKDETTSERISFQLLDYLIGVAYGLWSLRDHRSGCAVSVLAEIPKAWPSLPLACCGPGDVAGSADAVEILVDDSDHDDDIVRRVSKLLEKIWDHRADAVLDEMCDILGVNNLREYFRKPSKGGFWDDHLSQYSKSHRKAPIYWLLQSSKRNYALWLYYHRLDKDLLFKALVNYVEPKIRLEVSRIETLRSQKATAGESGKDAKRLGKEVERQEDLLSELRDFEDKLRRAANLHLEPDLNDGVVLNIAPLYELVPWKEARNYWDDLLQGKYEWSSIGKQLRQKGLVK
jgi:hypothetical protein